MMMRMFMIELVIVREGDDADDEDDADDGDDGDDDACCCSTISRRSLTCKVSCLL